MTVAYELMTSVRLPRRSSSHVSIVSRKFLKIGSSAEPCGTSKTSQYKLIGWFTL